MTLYTGSIRNKRKESDGIRISIMRFNRPYYDYDILIPTLAPSAELLMSYKKGKITWPQYETRFNAEVLAKNHKMIEVVSVMALENIVTLLCWEKTPEQCHRRLVAEECAKYHPKLKIVMR